MCVLSRLTPEILADHHISLGMISGLKAMYEPHHLPPCITEDGYIEWKHQPGAPDEDFPRKRDALCSAWIE